MAIGVLAGAGGAIWSFRAFNQAAARRAALHAYEEADRLRKTSDAALRDFLGCVTGIKAVVPHTREDLEKTLAVGNEGQYGRLSDRIQRECAPPFRALLDRLSAESGWSGVKPQWKNYEQAARAAVDSAVSFGIASEKRAQEDAENHRMLDAAQRWSKATATADDALRFERFLACAVPDRGAWTNQDAFVGWLAKQCANGDPVGYLRQVRAECLPALSAPAEPLAEDDHLALARIQSPKGVANGAVGGMVGGCTSMVKQTWLKFDGTQLLATAGDAMAKQRELGRAVDALKPRLPSTS